MTDKAKVVFSYVVMYFDQSSIFQELFVSSFSVGIDRLWLFWHCHDVLKGVCLYKVLLGVNAHKWVVRFGRYLWFFESLIIQI